MLGIYETFGLGVIVHGDDEHGNSQAACQTIDPVFEPRPSVRRNRDDADFPCESGANARSTRGIRSRVDQAQQHE